MDTQVLREDGIFNYSRLINRGATASRGDVLAFLNNEIEVEEKGWLREMVSHVLQPDVGAVGGAALVPRRNPPAWRRDPRSWRDGGPSFHGRAARVSRIF